MNSGLTWRSWPVFTHPLLTHNLASTQVGAFYRVWTCKGKLLIAEFLFQLLLLLKGTENSPLCSKFREVRWCWLKVMPFPSFLWTLYLCFAVMLAILPQWKWECVRRIILVLASSQYKYHFCIHILTFTTD